MIKHHIVIEFKTYISPCVDSVVTSNVAVTLDELQNLFNGEHPPGVTQVTYSHKMGGVLHRYTNRHGKIIRESDTAVIDAYRAIPF